MRVARYFFGLGVLVLLGGCKPSRPAKTPPPAVAGCPGGDPGPSVRYGSLNLTPTVGVVNTTPLVAKTLLVNMLNPAPSLQLDVGGPMIGNVFEICVVTNPPARKTHLGVDVTGVLEDPSPPSSAPGAFWQNVFGSLFVTPLQDDQTDASGVLKLDVPAQNLRNAISNPPPGFSSGRMLITITLSNGAHRLDLTLAPN